MRKVKLPLYNLGTAIRVFAHYFKDDIIAIPLEMDRWYLYTSQSGGVVLVDMILHK